MFTPRLPRHPLLRALAIRQLNERKAMLAAVMAEHNLVNQRTPVRSTVFK